jgi:hypothetical protein
LSRRAAQRLVTDLESEAAVLFELAGAIRARCDMRFQRSVLVCLQLVIKIR